MNWNKIIKRALFPHIALMIILGLSSMVFLIYSLIFMESDSVIAIVSYVLAFYTLTVWSLRIPHFIRGLKKFKKENIYARRWGNDTRLRVSVSLYGTLIFNTAYALLQLGMGFWHGSFWFYSLSGYYLCLAVMRFFLAQYTIGNKPGENMYSELIRYRTCGIIFLVMNTALSLMIFFMVYWNRTFKHHEITTIALAVYTFAAFTRAIINIIKYRKYNSPVYSASKAISLASACVSMLTLESTMLTTFGDRSMDMITRKIFLGCTGGVISSFIVVMAVYMIKQSNEKIEKLKRQELQNE